MVRVLDERLGVAVALKALHPHLARDPRWVARFEREARLLAGIRHPAVPAVHDLGRLPTGEPFYTMEEVSGDPFGAVAAAMPRSIRIELVQRVCAIVSHAHAIGVVHRDLSGANVLVAHPSEVRVVDWGLARREDEPDEAALDPDGPGPTRTSGTPGYCAPEQLAGATPNRRMDVYALGGLLSLALCGAPPHQRQATDDPELGDLVAECRAPSPADRLAGAAEVAKRLDAWSRGAARRGRSNASVADAEQHAEAARDLEGRAAEARANAATLLAGVPAHAPEGHKALGWAEEDRASALEAEAERQHVLAEQKLLLAVREDPSNDEPHDALVARWIGLLERAERTGDRRAGVRHATVIRSWRDGRYASRVDAPGTVVVETTPADAEVRCERYLERNRRWVSEPMGVLGRTPFRASLPPGSYRLRVSAPDHHEAWLPVVVPRGGAWVGRGPSAEPAPLVLLPLGSLGPDDRYVPAGWSWFGGDPFASDGLERAERYLAGFVLRRFPVTIGAYAAFLDDLAAAGELDEAEARVPRGDLATSISVTRRADGRFAVADGHSADWPVTNVSWDDAARYASWVGPGWRLPHDHEWERAARGADERQFPWGNAFDPTWTNMIASRGAAPAIGPVAEFPVDDSPYGVRGLAGNVRDWCANGYRRAGPPPGVIDVSSDGATELRTIRGGSWTSTALMCRSSTRFAAQPGTRLTSLGFRLARSLTAFEAGS